MIGPNGEKRPGDTIATGEFEETYVDESKRPGGKKGGRARADTLTPERRREIAKNGAAVRWGQDEDDSVTDFSVT